MVRTYFIVLGLLLTCAPLAAHAEFSSTPEPNSPAYNFTVTNIAPTNSAVYVSGDFSVLEATSAPHSVSISPSTGDKIKNFASPDDSETRHAIADGHGGWYITGTFDTVSGEAHQNIAHLLASGTVDAAFTASVNIAPTVLALSPDGTTLYLGGGFSTVDGVARRNAAAVSATTGALVTAYNPSPNNQIVSMLFSPNGALLYLSGYFSTIFGTRLQSLGYFSSTNASVSPILPQVTSGTVYRSIPDGHGGWYITGYYLTFDTAYTPQDVVHVLSDGTFDPSFVPPLSDTRDIQTIALSPDGNTLYMGGDFTLVNGESHKNVVALNASTGAIIPGFTADANGQFVFALTPSPDGTRLYIGGQFTDVNSEAHTHLAAVNASTGTVISAFNPVITPGYGQVNKIILSSDGTKVYIGGYFSEVNSDSAHQYLAAVNASDGSLVTAWLPSIDGQLSDFDLSPDGTKIYVAGYFDHAGGSPATGLAAVNTTNGARVGAFAPLALETSSAPSALAVSPDGATLYIGGGFTAVGATPRVHLAALNSSNGSLISGFAPNSLNGGYIKHITTSPDGTIVSVAGDFDTIGGTTRYSIAAVNTSDATLNTTFDTASPSSVNNISSMAFSPDNSILYIAGSFSDNVQIGGIARNAVASLNPTTGAGNAGFDTGRNCGVDGMAVTTATVYIYRQFSCNDSNNTLHPYLEAYHVSNGSLDSSFDYELDDHPLNMFLSLDKTKLYLSGYFSTVDSEIRNYMAAFDTSDNSLLPFNPNFDDSVYASALSTDGTSLYAGGNFQTLGGVYTPGIAAFSPSSLLTIESFAPGTLDSDQPFPEHRSLVVSHDGSKVYVGNGWTDGYIYALSTTDGSQVNGYTVPTFDDSGNDGIYSEVLSPDDSILYIGGRFVGVNGVTRNHVAAIHTSDGSLVTSFDPDVDDFVPALALSSDGSILYMGGDFTTVGGVGRSGLAAVHTSDGSLISGFAPTATIPSSNGNGGAANIRSLALSANGSTLYVGGGFTKINNTTRNRIAAVATSNGNLISSFNPNANNLVRIVTLSPDGTRLYVGGQFTTIAGGTHRAVASLSTTDGSSSSFAQTALDAVTGLAISPDGAHLYAGANWNNSSGQVFAVFTDPAFNTAGDTTPSTPHHPQVVSGGSSGGGSSSGGSSSSSSTKPPTSIPSPSTPLTTPSTIPQASPQGSVISVTIFVRSLTIGGQGSDVKTLQQYLNSHGFVIAPSGPGSVGNETLFFGALTRAALAKFQAAHGIVPAVGFFGPITRAYIGSHP